MYRIFLAENVFFQTYFGLNFLVENAENNEKTSGPESDVEFDQETLDILAEDPTSKTTRDLDLPSLLSLRWVEWLKSGISKEIKEEILSKYARKGNIDILNILKSQR